VLWAREAFGIRAFVETGTNRAATTLWASEHFAKVITIEGAKPLYEAAVAAHGTKSNIRFLHGDSRALLEGVLRELDEPAILRLDAHWCGEGTFGIKAECPLLEEIAAVDRSAHDHVVLIDDARLFVAPPPQPHSARDWPDLLQVSAALLAAKRGRYAAITEDVIAVVSESRRDALVEYLRRDVHAAVAPASLRRRVLRRVLGR
jgi:hypothetical protein